MKLQKPTELNYDIRNRKKIVLLALKYIVKKYIYLKMFLNFNLGCFIELKDKIITYNHINSK